MTSNSARKEYDSESSSSNISCHQPTSDNNDFVVHVAGAETGKTQKKLQKDCWQMVNKLKLMLKNNLMNRFCNDLEIYSIKECKLYMEKLGR